VEAVGGQGSGSAAVRMRMRRRLLWPVAPDSIISPVTRV
jgi:hypothetical protein